MKELDNLVNSLSEAELRLIEENLICSKVKDGSKLFRLFLQIKKKSQTEGNQNIQLKNTSSTKAAYTKLKSRLFQIILDVLVSDKAIENKLVYGDLERNFIRVRKWMLKFRAMFTKFSRPNPDVLEHISNHIISEAKKFELYDVLLEILQFKQSRVLLTEGETALKNIDAEIEFYDKARMAKRDAQENYLRLVSNKGLLKSMTPNQLNTFRSKSIERMEKDYKLTNSKTIAYFLFTIKLDQSLVDEDYPLAEKICLNLLELVKENQCIYQKERLGIIYDNYSIIKCFQFKFGEAIQLVVKARAFIRKNSYNFMASLEQEFYCRFYAGQFSEALDVIERIIPLSKKIMGHFLNSKYILQKAALYFKMGKHKESMKLCSDWLELEKEKARWDLGIRYLRIMNCIELEFLDQAAAQIEALRKFIERNEIHEFRKRDKMIYTLFNLIMRSGFQTKVSVSLSKILANLASNEMEIKYKLFSHELVRIDTWIRAYFFKKKRFSELITN